MKRHTSYCCVAYFCLGMAWWTWQILLIALVLVEFIEQCARDTKAHGEAR